MWCNVVQASPRRSPPPLFPLPPFARGGQGGAAALEPHPPPPRRFLSRRGGPVADATVDRQHLVLELRLPLLLLLRLLRLLDLPELCLHLLLLLSLALQERLRQEKLHSRHVQGVTTSHDRLCEEGHCGSHVTDRDCHTLRLGHLSERRRPRPRGKSLLSPKGVVRLADLSLSSPS